MRTWTAYVAPLSRESVQGQVLGYGDWMRALPERGAPVYLGDQTAFADGSVTKLWIAGDSLIAQGVIGDAVTVAPPPGGWVPRLVADTRSTTTLTCNPPIVIPGRVLELRLGSVKEWPRLWFRLDDQDEAVLSSPPAQSVSTCVACETTVSPAIRHEWSCPDCGVPNKSPYVPRADGLVT